MAPMAVRVVVLLLAAVLVAAAGCGGDDDEAGGDTTATETVATETQTTETETETTGGGAAADGEAVFAQAGCGGCHTLEAAGSSGQVGPNLDELELEVPDVVEQVREGGGGMPAFGDDLSDAEIDAVAQYVVDSSRAS